MTRPEETVRKAFVLKDDLGEPLYRSEKLSKVLKLRKYLESVSDRTFQIYIETTTQQKLEV